MIKTITWLCSTLMIVITSLRATQADESANERQEILREVNGYWNEVSRSAGAGDFVAYSATCHPQGVYISEINQSIYPLSRALEQWEPMFHDVRENRMQAAVAFRFSQRLYEPTNAHETGIFRFTSVADGEHTVRYVHFEALLQKTHIGWQVMLEHQKSAATEAEWKALAPTTDPRNR